MALSIKVQFLSKYVHLDLRIVDVLWGQLIKLIKLVPLQNFMNIAGATLILIFWFPWVCAGSQKPQASKTKYEKFGPKTLIPH